MREKTKNKTKSLWLPTVFWLIFIMIMFTGNRRETFPDWLVIAIQVFLAFTIVLLLVYLFKGFLFRKKEVPSFLSQWFEFFDGSSSREKTLEERYAEMLENEEEDDASEIAMQKK